MVYVRKRRKSDNFLRKKIERPWLTKHGDSRTRLYRSWQSMKYRCESKGHNGYSRYGGAGVKVCAEWRNNYLSFKDWALKNGYEDHLTIDRRDGKKGYTPENCRWVTYIVQNTNLSKLKTNTSGFRGVSQHQHSTGWNCNVSVKNKTVYIGTFPTKDEAADARDDYIRQNSLPNQLSRF